MARKTKKDPIYGRTQVKDGVLRYYADLRALGYGRPALKPPGSSRATDDPHEARILLGELLKDIRAGKVPKGRAKPKRQRGDETRLGPMADRFIKDNPLGNVPKSVQTKRRLLERAKKFFGVDRPLSSIEPRHIRKWMNKLREEGKAEQTVQHHIWALSPVFNYARELGTWTSTEAKNPIQRIIGKRSSNRGRTKTKKAAWLEIPEGAKILAAAERLERDTKGGLIDFVYPLIATFLLTGGNKAEVLGLTWDDIDFDLDFVTFRPNKWRPLKTEWRERTIKLWPQLAPILKAHQKNMMKGTPSELVFPSPRLAYAGKEGMIHDLRKVIRDIKKESGVDYPGEQVTIFRHTYATNRLQTTDGGKQIAVVQVANEMGHRDTSLIETVYGHPSNFRPRGEVVEYR